MSRIRTALDVALLVFAGVTLGWTPSHLAGELWPGSLTALIVATLIGWLIGGCLVAKLAQLPPPRRPGSVRPKPVPGNLPGTWKAAAGYTYTAAGDVVITATPTQHNNMSPVDAEEIAAALLAAAHHARQARIRHAAARRDLEAAAPPAPDPEPANTETGAGTDQSATKESQ